ncbi:MAG: hypothetical protein COA57_03710, partial [Flavobacteriales bacterium]
TSSAQHPNFTFPAIEGQYPVNLHVTVPYGCPDDTTIFVTIGKEECPACAINPNPVFSTGTVTFETEALAGVILEVFNISGNLISTLIAETLSEGCHNLLFDTSGLNSGNYMFVLSIDGQLSCQKPIQIIKN